MQMYFQPLQDVMFYFQQKYQPNLSTRVLHARATSSKEKGRCDRRPSAQRGCRAQVEVDANRKRVRSRGSDVSVHGTTCFQSAAGLHVLWEVQHRAHLLDAGCWGQRLVPHLGGGHGELHVCENHEYTTNTRKVAMGCLPDHFDPHILRYEV